MENGEWRMCRSEVNALIFSLFSIFSQKIFSRPWLFSSPRYIFSPFLFRAMTRTSRLYSVKERKKAVEEKQVPQTVSFDCLFITSPTLLLPIIIIILFIPDPNPDPDSYSCLTSKKSEEDRRQKIEQWTVNSEQRASISAINTQHYILYVYSIQYTVQNSTWCHRYIFISSPAYSILLTYFILCMSVWCFSCHVHNSQNSTTIYKIVQCTMYSKQYRTENRVHT